MRPIQERIKIVVGCDRNYFLKAKELWKSLDWWNYEVHVLCIGFNIPSDIPNNFKCIRVELDELKSYRPNFPKNRPFYVTIEGGEFLDYFDYQDDDIIVSIDADMIMQRDFNDRELYFLEQLKPLQVVGSLSGYPPVSVEQEYNNLKPIKPFSEMNLDSIKREKIICAGVVVCTAKTYRDVIYNCYFSNLDSWIEKIQHHALGQLLLNACVMKFGKIVYMPQSFHDAFWFVDTPTSIKEGKLYSNCNLTLFNHTKFDPRFKF